MWNYFLWIAYCVSIHIKLGYVYFNERNVLKHLSRLSGVFVSYGMYWFIVEIHSVSNPWDSRLYDTTSCQLFVIYTFHTPFIDVVYLFPLLFFIVHKRGYIEYIKATIWYRRHIAMLTYITIVTPCVALFFLINKYIYTYIYTYTYTYTHV